MIRYTLKCDRDHAFESWFQSADAFDALKAKGLVTCAVCGSDGVSKALMSPSLKSGGAVAVEEKPEIRAPEGELSEKLTALRKHVEENSTYVGGRFAEEAREMHSGDAPEKSIWGEAKPEEAKALIEDGIPVAPLPFLPKSQGN